MILFSGNCLNQLFFARATKTPKNGTTGFTFISNEVTGQGLWLETWWICKPFGVTSQKHYYPNQVIRDAGNHSRSKTLRVRVVRDEPNGKVSLRQ